MPLKFPPPGTAAWFRHAEQFAGQHHVDIQRLWQVVPQVPDPQAGIPFMGPLSPTRVANPVPSSYPSSSSSGP